MSEADFQPELFEPRHESLQRDRLRFDSAKAERVYARRWEEENTRRPGINRGYTLLEWILCPTRQTPRPVTQNEATTAACVVQWFGTNCGLGFILEAEKEIGILEHFDRMTLDRAGPHDHEMVRALCRVFRIQRSKSEQQRVFEHHLAGMLAEAREEGREEERRRQRARMHYSVGGHRGLIIREETCRDQA